MDGLMGVAGITITSDDMDHSRKFPAFSTSKKKLPIHSLDPDQCEPSSIAHVFHKFAWRKNRPTGEPEARAADQVGIALQYLVPRDVLVYKPHEYYSYS